MLARGVTGQHAEGRHRVVERGDQLVDAAHRDMHAGQRGDHAGVAFVGHEADSAGFGHGEVHAGNAHVGFGELAAQLAAGHAHEAGDVFGLVLAGFLGEGIGNLRAGQVDSGHDHVGRPFMAKLDDPFRKVGFHHFHALGFKGRIGLDFLDGHGFGLHDHLTAVVFRDLGDDAVGVGGISGKMHLHPALFGLFLELYEQLVEVPDRFVLTGGDFGDQLAVVQTGVDTLTAGPVIHRELVQGAALERILQRGGQVGTVVFYIACGFFHMAILMVNRLGSGFPYEN